MKLSTEDQNRITKAIGQAESKTSGEIATAFISESYDYAIYELLFSVVVGFIYFAIMLLFSTQIETWLAAKFWNYNVSYLLGFYGFSTFLVITIVYLLANLPSLDRLIVSKKTMQRKVHERALRHFVESGAYNTVHRTGILIFISALEHRVELLADSGINELIPAEKWDKLVQHIVQGIKENKPADYLIEAIEDCGKILSENFPMQAETVNELSDEISVLER
jgi:putative membrane protein